MSTLYNRLGGTAAVLLGLLAVSATPSFAQNRTNSNGINATDRDTGQNRAQDRRHTTTTPNKSNGTHATDRDKGLDRAQDRMNDHSLDSSRAGGVSGGGGGGHGGGRR
jgi:hypothetical protein